MVDSDVPKLTELLAELPAAYTSPNEDLELLAQELPLLHRVGRKHHHQLASSLPGTVLQPGAGSDSRERLGLSNRVFFWVGHCAYPETDLVLVWDGGFDEEHAAESLAAPWDTGGLTSKHTLGQKLDDEGARIQIERFSLAPPTYRQYLAHVLARCYRHPNRYLSGHRPTSTYPGHVQPIHDDAPPRHTFELRVEGEVPIVASLVGLAYDPTAFHDHAKAHQAIRRFAHQCELRLFDRLDNEPMSHTAERAVRALLRQQGIEP